LFRSSAGRSAPKARWLAVLYVAIFYRRFATVFEAAAASVAAVAAVAAVAWVRLGGVYFSVS